MPLIALRGGTIYVDPWSEGIRNGVVLIDGGMIVAADAAAAIKVPEGATFVDCCNTTITAGFWNSHVHLTERKWGDALRLPAAELHAQLQDFTRYGFTSVFDLSSHYNNTKIIRQRIDAGEVSGPRILSTGEGIIPIGATPPDIVSKMMGWMSVPMLEANSAESAAAKTRLLLDRGVDGVKMFASGERSGPNSRLSLEVMSAVVQVAHAAAIPVFVHPNTIDDVRRAVEAGADIIAHTIPRAQSWKSVLTAMTRAGLALIPTLNLWKQMTRHDRHSFQAELVDSAAQQLAFIHAGGGSVLFGTDHGAVDPDPRDEYRLMGQAGMSFADILQSLTTAPSQRFTASTTGGTLRAGEPADIVVLNGENTCQDIFRNVRLTIRAGQVIYRATRRYRSTLNRDVRPPESEKDI